MSEFDVELYRAELAKLKEHVREMDEAIDNLKFECGPNGVSSRGTYHLEEFNNAKGDASLQMVNVINAMLPGLKDES